MEAHIWPLGVPWLAWESVFAFYTLSGFLMTRVLHERYGFSPIGIGRFALNRVLRLWPAYMLVLAFTTVAIAVWGPMWVFKQLPKDWSDIVLNLTVVGQVGVDFEYGLRKTILVGNAWSLSIEVFCYLLLALYFAKTPTRLWMLVLIGALGLSISTAHCIAHPDAVLQNDSSTICKIIRPAFAE